ncbi:unnamed protein product [Ectocarpus sp. 6 AP-2014]
MANIWNHVLDASLDGVGSMLEDGVPVDSRNSLGETPLHLAARHGLEEMATVLIDAGASVHLKDWESGWTPLHRSLYFGHIRLSLLLLQAGALLDGGRDQPDRDYRQKHRARSRSESVSATGKSRSGTSARRRINDGLGDFEGNSPLDVLSLELRNDLKTARESGVGGDVFSFGKADFTLGYDSFGRADIIPPRRVESLANLHVTRVAASKHHSAAVTVCGKLFTWGHGKSGRLGHGNEEVCMLPTQVEGLAHQAVTDVAVAETHTAALTREGELYTWGRDRFGQLGHGSAGSSGRFAPKRVEGLRKVTVVAVAAGTEHTAVATSSGHCYTFGRNNHGQLGLAGVKETCAPRVVSYLASGASRGAGGVGRHVIKVSASARSTVVVTRGIDRGSGLQTVNEVHQWGHGSPVPSRVSFNSAKDASPSSRWQTHDARVDIVDVAAARCHNVALDRVGMVFTWGFGADHLGLDPRETRTARGPQLVAAMLPENCGGNPISVSASDQHSCVVTDTGDLFTWGTSGGEGGALGHGSNRWQPLAKRVPSLKKVTRVAAAPDHTVVLLQASCPSLPHGAAFATVDALSNEHEDGGHLLIEDEEEDAESDIDDGDDGRHDSSSHGGGLFTTNPAGGFEPLTLKQCCEAKLAREVDLHNAGAMLAYADALDAPALLLYCAEYVKRNLDAVLVLGCASTTSCLLEASGELVSSLLCGARSREPTARASAVAEPSVADGAGFGLHEEEGLDLELQATALARADMRAKTPSAKVAARAVRSLKKKIARVREWERMREKGKDLSADQMSKVDQMGRMEAELTSLDSQLERAKLAQAARSSRLEAGSARATEASPSSKTPEVKRTLFRNESGMDGRHIPALDPDLDATSASSLKTGEWTPQLDLSHDDTKATEKRTINCEACSIKCASAAMYADHLRGRRHRATTLRLEQQLHKATKESQPEPQVPRSWASVPAAQDHSAAAAAAPDAAANCNTVPTNAKLPHRSEGRQASCPEASPSHAHQARRPSNQLPRGKELSTMRHALEGQQRAATMLMGSTGKEEAATATQGMNFLRSTARGDSQRLQSQQQDAPTTAVYSLVDFMAPSNGKKSSRRTQASEKPRAVHAWKSEAAGPVEPNSPSSPAEAKEFEPLRTRKSFHEILEEEEREKLEREEYGKNAWFIPGKGKPRSTSFEGIVQQQRREEMVAEEEKLRQMEEEMLGLALEMSKQEAQPTRAQSRGSGSRKGREGRGGRKQESRAPRKHPSARAKGSQPLGGVETGAKGSQPRGGVETDPRVQSRNGRRRRAKRSSAVENQAAEPTVESSGSR